MTARLRTITASYLAAAAAVSVLGCGAASDSVAPAATAQEKRPSQPTRVVLTGQGIAGARIGAPAATVQRLATRVLGAPDSKGFTGCTLGGPTARYGERTWQWGALALVFENRATTAKVAPGRFTAWMVSRIGKLHRAVELPHGITRRSTMEDVRANIALARASDALPGEYALTGADGIDYTFNKATRRLDAMSLRGPMCE